ncbi:N-acetylmuramic acid 6-phosphate etherase [Pseudalkalibacillus caeni]|uniref:N-acetylmuramic acid 6-phosphate etherase n=1 Tax=Exobacillus caeni TaxID=2574798 RepID=A0A5R9FC63_9BACL|nr:N-acetylmuramic acid 6-phosphate etherase [Pseudalkalibacillus caeni]TLS38473.1 N-acetylmuramic acid 6-phosphate etherase [Pseudalkalibacillus caeni]
MKQNQSMVTEQRNKESEKLDTFSVREIIEIMNKEDKTVAYSVERSLPQIEAATERIVEVMRNGGKLYYIGAGTSGRLGILDASECPPTFGVDPGLVNGIIAGGEKAIKTAIENAEDSEEGGNKDVEAVVTEKDAVVGIASSGRTPYVLGAIQKANQLGALTVGVSCNPGARLSEIVQYPIEVMVGPEVVTGSTRLKAGTAQKMVLNMISTTVMIKLGKVYGNLMVNVQATNEKLRDRVVRIIQEVTGVSQETAREYSDKAKGDARAAILMITFQISIEEATETLKQTNDHFPEAMKRLSTKYAGSDPKAK